MDPTARWAFTLAEVLITLGIIGVVSAMTLPVLARNHQRQVFLTQLHKFYNTFTQATESYMADKNAVNLVEANLFNYASLDDFMKKYFKISKDCTDNKSECFTNDYKKINGTPVNPIDSTRIAYVLADGTTVALFISSNLSSAIQMHVDVNGKTPPNIVGRDLFAIMLYPDGSLDENCSSPPCTVEYRETNFSSYCSSSANYIWWGCFGKILNDGWKMNY